MSGGPDPKGDVKFPRNTRFPGCTENAWAKEGIPGGMYGHRDTEGITFLIKL